MCVCGCVFIADVVISGKITCEIREPETLNNVWKKQQTGSGGRRNQRKKNITHRKMCRLKLPFPPLKSLGHLNLEGFMQKLAFEF